MGNLKIGVRLGLGFGLLVFLLAVIAIISVTRLNANTQMTDEIVNDRHVKVVLALRIKSDVNATARNLRNVLLASNPEEAKKFIGKMDETAQVISGNIEKLGKMINTPQGEKIFKELVDARTTYRGVRDQIVKLLNEGAKDKAVELLFKEAIPTQEAYFTALDKMADFQAGVMDRIGKEAIEQAHGAVMQVTALSVIAVLMSVVAGIFITRSIIQPLHEAVKVAQTVAAGDLTSRIEVTSKDETGQLLVALKDMNHALVNIVNEVRGGTDTIASASQQIASGNADLSSRTESQASSLEETASSMEELTSTVKQNADNARQANQLAVSASEVAVKGGAVVSEVVDTMGSINESAKKIVDIIGVIDGIAFQTNILALNAAVEAARAGEQGRGFAVVASEVRNLAQRSAQAAKEIKALIDTSVEKVDAGSKLVDQAGVTMQEVVESIRRVTDIMGEISAASAEQTSGIEQVQQAITQMDETTQQNAALVEEAAAASESLREQAGKLTQVVSVFKLEGMQMTTSAPVPPAKPKAAVAPTAKKPASVVKTPSEPLQVKRLASARAGNGDDWEEF